MQTIAFNGTLKESNGKSYNANLRKDGKVPAVLYNKQVNKQFSLDPRDIKHLIYTPDFKLAEITLEGKKYKCIVKNIQWHPVTDEIVHIDFLALIEGEKFNVKVPLRTRGASPGVKLGGKLIQSVRYVDIKTTPEDLVDVVTVDISKMELGGTVRVKDIDPVNGVEVTNIPATPVAIIEIPRALKSAAAKEAAAAKGKKK